MGHDLIWHGLAGWLAGGRGVWKYLIRLVACSAKIVIGVNV